LAFVKVHKNYVVVVEVVVAVAVAVAAAAVGMRGTAGRQRGRRRCKAIEARNIDAVVSKCCHLDLSH
jgi:hypothetical protein